MTDFQKRINEILDGSFVNIKRLDSYIREREKETRYLYAKRMISREYFLGYLEALSHIAETYSRIDVEL